MQQKRIEFEKLISFKFLLILTVNIILELLLQIVVGYSDQLMIASDQDAVTAITNTNTILNVFIITFQVLATGSIILIGHYKGQGRFDKEKSVYYATFVMNAFAGILISLILLSFSRFFFTWINLDPTCMDKGLTYIRIVGGTIFLQAIITVFSAFLKANACMKESTIVNVLINIINIIGNFILIPKLGIMGVAISSATSRLIGTIVIILMFYHKTKINVFKNCLKNFSFKTAKKVLSIGGPSGGEALSYNSSQIVILGLINTFGTNVVNIRAYASMFAMISYMFTSAISQAMQVLIGQLLGMGKVEEAKKMVYKTLIASVISSLLVATLFFVFSDQAFAIFRIKDSEMLELGKKIMLIEITLEFGRAFNIVFVRSLQTIGDVVFPTVLSIIFCWSVAVGGSFLLGSLNGPFALGLVGVWISMACDECIRGVIFVIRFKSERWRKNMI